MKINTIKTLLLEDDGTIQNWSTVRCTRAISQNAAKAVKLPRQKKILEAEIFAIM